MIHKFMIQCYQEPTQINSCGIDNSEWHNTCWGSNDFEEAVATATKIHKEQGKTLRILQEVFQIGEEKHDLY